jgi:hypothetical protein
MDSQRLKRGPLDMVKCDKCREDRKKVDQGPIWSSLATDSISAVHRTVSGQRSVIAAEEWASLARKAVGSNVSANMH